MSDDVERDGSGDEQRRAADDEAEVSRLLAAAGRRPELPATELAWVRETVRGAWAARTETAAPRTLPFARRRAFVAALAAGLAAAIGLSWWWSARVQPSPVVATVAASKGDVAASGAAGAPGALDESQAPAVGALLSAGVELRTAAAADGQPGFVALRLAAGGSLRLDAGSRVRLLAADEIALDEGAVYVDGDGHTSASQLVVRTPLGDVRELGTQFTVRLSAGGGELRVRVREGAVAATAAGGRHRVPAGQELIVDRAGRTALRPTSAFGAEWAWVLETSPRFAGDGRTVAELLHWVSRETGWRIDYEGDAAAEAFRVVLHGDVGALAPDRAAFAVLPGAGLEAELREGTLTVGVAH